MSGFFNTNRLNKRVDRLELLLNSTPETPSPSWGNIEGDLQDQTDLQTALDFKGNLRIFNQWMGSNIYTGQVQFHNEVYVNDRTGLMFDPETTSTTKTAYAQIAYSASTNRHFKFKVHGILNSIYWGNLDFSGILTSDKTFVFPNKSGTIALLDDVPNPADFATAAQGALANTAVQPGDNVSTLANDAGYITGTTGFSGSFVTATDTITVVNGLITAVAPL